ncbi:MAG: hypothetical protein HY909_02845 [Deltaproteobacteria bacterium]|nr:hypothetical protein [Deltaproteobacteria bacterium]
MSAPLAVLVPSCDPYRDLWRPFHALFRRHWRDCPLPVYAGSNHVPCEEPGVTPLLVGDDRDWSSSTRKMLQAIPEDYVLILLEDFFLQREVPTALLTELLGTLQALDGAYLRLRPFPAPDVRLVRHPRVGEIDLGAPYRASMQPALWHKASLLELLKDGENAWQFEIFGARRSDLFARGFYSVWEPALELYAGVVTGRWIPYGVAVCREQGVEVDLSARPMLSPREAARRNVNRVLNEAAELIPWRARNRILRWVRATGLRKPRPIPVPAKRQG